MKIWFVTNNIYPSKAANSIQIKSMLLAFYSYCGINSVRVFLPWNGKLKPDNFHSVNSKRNRIFRYVELYFKFLYNSVYELNKRDVIFTRDPFFIFLRVFFWKNTILLELHSDIKYIYWVLIKLFSIRVISISGGIKSRFGVKLIIAHDTFNPIFTDGINNVFDMSVINSLEWLNKEFPTILHTGSIYKGSLEVFLELAIKNPNFLFIHYGGTNEEISNLKRTYGIYENLFLYPNVPHLKILMLQRVADYLFYYNSPTSSISKYTSPLKLFEYLDAGKPIIGNNYGSVSEILVDGSFFDFSIFENNSLKNKKLYCDPNIQFKSWGERVSYILDNTLKLCNN